MLKSAEGIILPFPLYQMKKESGIQSIISKQSKFSAASYFTDFNRIKLAGNLFSLFNWLGRVRTQLFLRT